MLMFLVFGIGWRTGGWSRVVSSRLPSKRVSYLSPIFSYRLKISTMNSWPSSFYCHALGDGDTAKQA